MPRTLVGAQGLRRFQTPAIAGGTGTRQTLQQFAEMPKIHVANVRPGINQPVTAMVSPPVELVAAQPAPESEVVPEVVVQKKSRRKKQPEPEPEPESESPVEDSGEESEIEEAPKPRPRKRPAKVDTQLAEKFVQPKVETVVEPEKPKRTRKKKVVEEGAVEKPKRAPSEWHLFMKEAKEWPDVKERKGNERIKYMGELYQKRKKEKAEGKVEEVKESAEV